MLKYLLILLGVLTAIVLIAPQLVIVGYVFLIIPGLILTAIPTLFVYLLATVLIRRVLPMKPGIGATMTSAGLAIALGFLVMLPWRMIEINRYQQASLPEIVPQQKIRLSGNVLVEFPPARVRPKDTIECDHLCTALLDTPGIESVTRVVGEKSLTFRRGPNARGTLVIPEQPQKILDAFHKISNDRNTNPYDATMTSAKALQADWALRIANGDELRQDAPLASGRIDWRVHALELREKGNPRVQRIEVRDRHGMVKARKSSVQHRIPAPFFYFGFDAGSAMHGFATAKFTVGGSTFSNQTRPYDFDPDAELLRIARIREPKPANSSIALLEQRLTAVLDDPLATDAQLLMAPVWLRQFQYDAGEEQLAIIAKILADERIPEPYQQLRTALRSDTDLTELRTGLANRILTTDEPRARSWYVSALVDLPDGTFAKPSKDEQAIWKLAISVQETAPFLERMADRGSVALPELMGVLDDVLDERWHARWRVLRGIRAALQRMGPRAAAEIPRITTLMSQRPSPLINSAGDRQEWLVALNRMGVAAEDLPYGPRIRDPSQLKNEVKRVRNQVQRYEASRSSSVSATES